jgi:hypothetical protein
MSITRESVNELSLCDLKQRWRILRSQYGIHELQITECFQRHGSRSFIIENLNMVLDNDNWVCCYDTKNILLKECSVLSLFLQHQVTNIEIIPLIEERLEFGNDGYVLIRLVS